MELSPDFPSQYLFNTLKHHSGSVGDFIQMAKVKSFGGEQLNSMMKKIGQSMIDFYYGGLTPSKIALEIGMYLSSINCFEKKSYCEFIQKKQKKYRTVELSDGSSWIMLLGRESGNYIHIHPARESRHTIRIKAISLKTAIFIRVFYAEDLANLSIVALANEVRQKYLDEPPLKNELNTKGIQRVLSVLE